MPAKDTYVLISAPVIPLTGGDSYNDLYGGGSGTEENTGTDLGEGDLIDLI